jgi:hypothetical protein
MPKYPPVGRCIYCGTKTGKLSTEHIVPYALGGNHELPQASCDPCARIINKEFEEHCCRKVFGQYRIREKMQTRNPKQRPTHLPVVVQQGSEEATIMVEVDDHPSLLPMPVFGHPGFVKGEDQGDKWPDGRIHMLINEVKFEQLEKYVGSQSVENCFVDSSVDPGKVARLLAKIAHGFGVVRYGYDGFEKFLPGIILGKNKNTSYLVGGELEITKPNISSAKKGRGFHNVHVFSQDFGVKKDIVVARIQLFSHLETPRYYIIVGRLRGAIA